MQNKPQVIWHGISTRISRQTSSDSWRCTRWRFQPKLSENCNCMAAIHPWTVTAGYAKKQSPCSYNSYYQQSKTSVFEIVTKQADILWRFLEANWHLDISFGKFWKVFILLHYLLFQWFVFLRQLNALFILHFTPTTQLDPSWANLWLLVSSVYR